MDGVSISSICYVRKEFPHMQIRDSTSMLNKLWYKSIEYLR